MEQNSPSGVIGRDQMRHLHIWVLITDGDFVRICSSGDGGPPCEKLRGIYQVKTGYGFPGGSMLQFAEHLAQILEEAATEKCYEALILIASCQIAEELERVLDPKTRALLIGDIVWDHSLVKPKSHQLA